VLEVGVVVSDGVREGEGFVTEGKLYQNREDCKVDDSDDAAKS
jgi:hypothetical protein